MQTLGKKNVTLKQINSKKQEMYKKAKNFGMTHPLVVACSQELDLLLNQYQGFHQYEHVGWINKSRKIGYFNDFPAFILKESMRMIEKWEY